MPTVPPPVGENFAWEPASWGLVLRARALGHVAHGWTTRQLALAGGPGTDAGWAEVAGAAGVPESRLLRLRQVHGAAVHVAGAGTERLLPQADIAVSCDAAYAVAVQAADCAPILLASPDGRSVAGAHAGWRGTVAGAAAAAVSALASAAGIRPDSLVAAIGPSIGPCCYIVGDDVRAAFATGEARGDSEAWFHRTGQQLKLDIWQANADQLIRAGLPARQVFVSRLCTACHASWFYSYRRDGAGTGRLAAFIRARAD